MNKTFQGFERNNGFGTRNHVLIIPTVICAEYIAKKIKEGVKGFYSTPDGSIKVLDNALGCGQTGEDLEQTTRTLINVGLNPNVHSVLVLSLGCESVNADRVADEISKNKPVYFLRIQDHGGKATIDLGIEKIKSLASEAAKSKRKTADISELTLGLECGGSDFTSGLVSNPIVGKVSDWIVSKGGSSIISEIPEFIGAEHIYARRAINEEVRNKIIKMVHKFETKLKTEAKVDFRNAQPSPGNIAGGLTTIEEKSLGAVKKSGSMPVQGVLDYAEKTPSKGHFLMNTPGYDVESVSGEVAGGANIVLFTTGRGTPTGNVIVPVIKMTGNSMTYSIMHDIIDFDASKVMSGEETFESAAKRLEKLLLDVVSGKQALAEVNEQDDFGIYKIGPTY